MAVMVFLKRPLYILTLLFLPCKLIYIMFMNLCLQGNRCLCAHPVDDTVQRYAEVHTDILSCFAHLCWHFLPCTASECSRICRW